MTILMKLIATIFLYFIQFGWERNEAITNRTDTHDFLLFFFCFGKFFTIFQFHILCCFVWIKFNGSMFFVVAICCSFCCFLSFCFFSLIDLYFFCQIFYAYIFDWKVAVFLEIVFMFHWFSQCGFVCRMGGVVDETNYSELLLLYCCKFKCKIVSNNRKFRNNQKLNPKSLENVIMKFMME